MGIQLARRTSVSSARGVNPLPTSPNSRVLGEKAFPTLRAGSRGSRQLDRFSARRMDPVGLFSAPCQCMTTGRTFRARFFWPVVPCLGFTEAGPRPGSTAPATGSPVHPPPLRSRERLLSDAPSATRVIPSASRSPALTWLASEDSVPVCSSWLSSLRPLSCSFSSLRPSFSPFAKK
jgi:hypothetical protein